MDSKFGLIFIFLFVYVVRLGGPQMLMVEGGGLECSICLRIGDAGSKTCARMPCNSADDRKVANAILRTAIDDILKSDEFKKVQEVTKNTSGEEIIKEVDIEEDGSDDGDGDKIKTKTQQEFECVKGIGEQTLKQKDGETFKLRMVEGSCQKVNHKQDYPASSEPYKSLSYDGILPDTVIEMQSLWICNQTNQLNCKITQEELEKGVLEATTLAGGGGGGTEATKASGASPSPSTHLLPAAVSWLLVLCVSQLLIDFYN